MKLSDPIPKLGKLRCWHFLVPYIAIYVILSLLGSEEYHPSGRHRYAGGLAVSDEIIHAPKYLWFELYIEYDGKYANRGNFAGHMFAPLILIDRKLWHRTVDLGGDLETKQAEEASTVGP
jgi:hypothetical protein